jgi:hypothetical protein
MTSQDGDYLVPPLGSDEIRFEFSAGNDVQLSDAAKAALETLLAELTTSDVAGFMRPPSLGGPLADCSANCGINICLTRATTGTPLR